MASPEYHVIGASLTLVRVLMDCHFMSIDDRKRISSLTSSCVIQKFSIVSKLCHIWLVIGLSVSWKVCDKIFLDSHIWSLYCQCHEMHVTKFSWMAIYGHWIIGIVEVCERVLLKEMATVVTAVWSSLAWKLYNATFVKLQGDMHAIGWIAQCLYM